MSIQSGLSICSTPTLLSRLAADFLVQVIQETVVKEGRVALCLSGGSTPRELYSLLSCPPYCHEIPWKKVHIFWGDERHISLDEPDNHYRMAMNLFLSKVPIPPHNIHRMVVEIAEPDRVAKEYEFHLRTFFGLPDDGIPQFDLIFLGMGADGHTASLFPGTTALNERKRLVVSNYVPRLGLFRMTLTLPVFNQGRKVVFLVSGTSKSAMLKTVLQDSKGKSLLPAQMVCPVSGEVLWLVDKDAASRL